jgi:hypothetical protein
VLRLRLVEEIETEWRGATRGQAEVEGLQVKYICTKGIKIQPLMSVLAAGYPPTAERPSLPVYYLKQICFNCLALQRILPVLVLDPLQIFGGLQAIYAPTQNNIDY